MKHTIGILDDHTAIRGGIRFFLEQSGFQVVLEAASQDECIQALELNVPDVLIVDVVLPDSKGIDSFTRLLEHYPQVKIVAYTSLDNLTLVSMLMQSGVMAYVSKNEQFERLAEACRTVLQGKSFLPQKYQHLLKRFRTTEGDINLDLSPREMDVLQLIGKGLTTQEMAEKLFISVNTIETHRKNLFRKFEVNNLALLIQRALETGFLH